MAVLINERDKLLSSTTPRLVDPGESDPLVVTASSLLLKYVADPASPSELTPGGSVTLYALTSRIGDVSWGIIGGPITGVTLSANVGGNVNLVFTNALVTDSVGVLASINNTNYSPASVQITLNFTKQLPAKSIKNLTVYKRGTVTPSTPTGGNYVFSSNTLVPPSGWSVNIPSGTDPVYSSTTQVFTYKDDSDIAINTSGWATPVLTVQNGTNGTNGAPGPAGQRGSIDLYVIGSSWSDTAANNAIYSATGSYVKYAGDKVTIYNNAGFAQTKYWDGISSWVTGQIIDGNLLVSGTVTSDKIGANTISAATIDTTGAVRASSSLSVAGGSSTKASIVGYNTSSSGSENGVYGYSVVASGVLGTCASTVGGIGVQGLGYYGGYFTTNASAGSSVYAVNPFGGTAVTVDGKLQWGSVPAYSTPPNTGTKFLRDDGTWATPGGSSGVTSFNTRTGAVTLNSTDVANAVVGSGVTLQASITGNAGSVGGYTATDFSNATTTAITNNNNSFVTPNFIRRSGTSFTLTIPGVGTWSGCTVS